MVIPITPNETYLVRQKELRQGKPIETCMFNGDELSTTFHMGYLINNEIIGVVSAFLNNSVDFEYDNQYQIRGMAVLSEYQNKGIGKKLFLEMEQFLIKRNINFIWFNARLIAVPFYKSLNCVEVGNQFEIEDVGPHFLIFKKI